MIFSDRYACLEKNLLKNENFEISPIKFEDQSPIMNWRNDQINLLRQDTALTVQDQKNFFSNVVGPLFEKRQPDQLLFGFYENGALVGYGGLVHIDWISSNAEISFLLKTELSGEDSYLPRFEVFLGLMEELGKTIPLHKIYTYGYVLEMFRFEPLLIRNFHQDARLKKHKIIGDNYCDVLIFSKLL